MKILRLENGAKECICVDLGESFPTSIYLQNLASIQALTSPFKFARSPRTDPPGRRQIQYRQCKICCLARSMHCLSGKLKALQFQYVSFMEHSICSLHASASIQLTHGNAKGTRKRLPPQNVIVFWADRWLSLEFPATISSSVVKLNDWRSDVCALYRLARGPNPSLLSSCSL